jgi:hypothetical protein
VCYARLIIPLVIAMQGSCSVLMTIDVLKSRKPYYCRVLLVMLIRKGGKNVVKGRRALFTEGRGLEQKKGTERTRLHRAERKKGEKGRSFICASTFKQAAHQQVNKAQKRPSWRSQASAAACRRLQPKWLLPPPAKHNCHRSSLLERGHPPKKRVSTD